MDMGTIYHEPQFKIGQSNRRVRLDSSPRSRYIYPPGHQRKLYPMGFFSFLVLLVIAYLIWRVTDQLPDLIFRLSEVQRDVAELRRSLSENDDKATNATLRRRRLHLRRPLQLQPRQQHRPHQATATASTAWA